MTANRTEGLRERKKARTRAAIQDAALRLYLKQGYHATTVDQIADAAEVSPSTFFRYFATKEDTVIYDRLDPIFVESFLGQPASLSPLAAIRAAIREVFAGLSAEALQLERARWALVADEPKLRAALANQVEGPMTMMTEAVAKRTGRQPDDFAVACWTGAVVGALYAAVLATLDRDDQDPLDMVDKGLEYLEAGLPL